MPPVFQLVVLIALVPVQDNDGDPVDLHLRQLKSGDAASRIAAVANLAELGPKAKKAVPVLVKLLGVEEFKGLDHESLQLHLAIALSKIGKAAVPALAKRLNDPDNEVRYHVLSALAWMGPDAKEVLPAIGKALRDPGASVRRKAVFALGQIKSGGPETVALLLKSTSDESPAVRQAVMQAVPCFGVDAVEPLRAFLKETRADDKTPFADALLPGKSGNLVSRKIEGRAVAPYLLGALGKEARPAIPDLLELLNGSNETDRNAARASLGRIGIDAVPALAAAVKHERAEVAEAAVEALNLIGGPAVPDLVDALSSEHAAVRSKAVKALSRLRVEDKTVVLGLARVLADPNRQVRYDAAYALSRIGPAAAQAIPALKKLLQDPDEAVRSMAQAALYRIEPRSGDGSDDEDDEEPPIREQPINRGKSSGCH